MAVFDPRRVRKQLERNRQTHGGRDWPASFKDRLTEPLPGLRMVLRMMRERRNSGPSLADARNIPVRRADALPPVPADRAAVTWVGHASYVVRMGGRTILTDPVWSRRIPGVRSRLTPPGVRWESLPEIDAVVISHNHFDHLDAPTIRRLPRTTPIYAPAMLGWWFRRRGFTTVHELDWWEALDLGPVRLEFVPAHHWSRRGAFDTCKSLWGGWVLSSGEFKIYFAGDTGYGHWFAEIGARHPDIDLALLPVGAYEPRWFMRAVHTNPAEAVRACLDLGAPRMAAMHWGTFILSAEPLLAPVQEAIREWESAGMPRDDLWDLAVGETRLLPAGPDS
ncbi:membrane protein [Virgisporangium aliadipatigenens]|uniref:Membrane protein n=1 Tax=Virgisporangium aliadipatigenens TaxID=741659 RepID=A0A8J4DP74_9ACTN|nr:MBL fold metallo-hydrolase [Virgisporangium aliadipatigenens]GIJ44606.1 membrane protein [Virgisporangium aliadipatigenens]